MLLGGKTVFPITLGNGPPLTGKDPVSGLNGWAEVAAAGVKMLRVYPKWDAANVAQQIQSCEGGADRSGESRASSLGWALQRGQ